MRQCSGIRPLLVAFSIVLFALGLVPAAASAKTPDFTFIHASDVHAPMAQSREVISSIKALGEIDFAIYGTIAPKPSFAIVTGDLNEFGGGNGWWEEYLSYWEGCGIPVYHIQGNHDSTWRSNGRNLRNIGQGPCYYFDRNGCRFIGITSATVQDPRPSIGEEQITWVKDNLRGLDPGTPLFVFFHHPLGGTEFASRYDHDRLLDVLQDYNTVLLMAGHSHGFVYRPFESWDLITGGSTFGPNAGLMFVSVKDGVLRAAYRKATDAAPTVKILEKPIPDGPTYPKIEILSPRWGSRTQGVVSVSARVSRIADVTKAAYSVDDEIKGDLSLSGSTPVWTATASVGAAGLLPGAHYLRLDFQNGDRHYTRSTQFFIEPASRPTAWRVYLGASSKATPTVIDGAVYVGANDGKLRAFAASDGREVWSVDTGAEILTQPLVSNGRVVVGNGNGLVAAYSTSGNRLWTFTADDAVYSSPVECDSRIVFGCNSGKLYALDATTGKESWTNSDAAYTVESKPFVWNGKIYYGAWDSHVRCVDGTTGKLIWKQMGEGSLTEKAARYYSPADCGPVVVDGMLIVADRNYMLTILNAETGERVKAIKQVSGVGVSEDGKSAYLRKTTGELMKIDPRGNEIWSVPCQLDVIPTPPVEKNGVVYVASKKGMVSAVSAKWGKVLWRYQASPQLFVMSALSADDARVYVIGFDGHLTAIRTDWKPAEDQSGSATTTP
jgi:outer membrane protein assembly factor BamB